MLLLGLEMGNKGQRPGHIKVLLARRKSGRQLGRILANNVCTYWVPTKTWSLKMLSSCCCCSVAQLCPTFWNPMDCSMPGLPVHHQLLELTQTHVHWVSDTIQPFHPLSLPSPPTFNLSQHQGLFQWVTSSLQVAKVLDFQLQRQSFQWIFRTDFLQDGLVGFPCNPRDSQESSSTPQFKSISSSALSFLYSPTLISMHDYWKSHSFYKTDFYWQSNVSVFNMLSCLVIGFLPRSKCLKFHGCSHPLQWFPKK